jgi:hypothetical protein
VQLLKEALKKEVACGKLAMYKDQRERMEMALLRLNEVRTKAQSI